MRNIWTISSIPASILRNPSPDLPYLERYKSSLDRQIGETIYIRSAIGTVLNDRDEFNRCELPVLSVSKQVNKATTNSRDREIIEETDRLQGLRPETQFKRQQISRDRDKDRDEKERDKVEMKEPVMKRQRRFAAPRKRQTEIKDIRYRDKGMTEMKPDDAMTEIETDKIQDRKETAREMNTKQEIVKEIPGETDKITEMPKESETDNGIKEINMMSQRDRDRQEIRLLETENEISGEKDERITNEIEISGQYRTDGEDKEMKLMTPIDRDRKEIGESENKNEVLRESGKKEIFETEKSGQNEKGGDDKEMRVMTPADRDRENEIKQVTEDKETGETEIKMITKAETLGQRITDRDNREIIKISDRETTAKCQRENCVKSVSGQLKFPVKSKCENSSTTTVRGTRGDDRISELKTSDSGPNVEENLKSVTSCEKSKVKSRCYSKVKPIHTYFGKSDIGSTNPQPIKKPIQANLKSSFKPSKPRKCRQIKPSNNSLIMDYFKIESTTNLDLLGQYEHKTNVMTDSKIVSDQ